MEIADEIKQRPEAGARRLVAEYRERLYQVAYRLCLNAADADDAKAIAARNRPAFMRTLLPTINYFPTRFIL